MPGQEQPLMAGTPCRASPGEQCSSRRLEVSLLNSLAPAAAILWPQTSSSQNLKQEELWQVRIASLSSKYKSHVIFGDVSLQLIKQPLNASFLFSTSGPSGASPQAAAGAAAAAAAVGGAGAGAALDRGDGLVLEGPVQEEEEGEGAQPIEEDSDRSASPALTS